MFVYDLLYCLESVFPHLNIYLAKAGRSELYRGEKRRR